MIRRFLTTFVVGFIALFVFVESSGANASGEWDAEVRASNIRFKSLMKAGYKSDVNVKINNIGTAAWSRSEKVRLVSRIYRVPSSAPIQRGGLTLDAEIGDDIAPNTSVDVEYRVEAQDYVGTYAIERTMMKRSTKFGDRVKKTIKIVE